MEYRKPRKITDSRGEFPYADPRVPFILISGEDGGIDAEGDGMNWAYEIGEKLALIETAKGSTAELLTVWPGKTRSDVFFMDDLDEAETVLRAAA